MAMKLTTGKVAFPIEFDNGDKQNIYFNPASKTFRDKLFNFEKSIDARMKQIDVDKYKSTFDDGIDVDVNISNIDDIMKLSPEQLESLKNKATAMNNIGDEYQNAIKAELDDIFESPISGIVFKYCEPLDPVVFINDNGEEETELFVMQFLRALSVEINNYSATRGEAVQKHMSKYTEMKEARMNRGKKNRGKK